MSKNNYLGSEKENIPKEINIDFSITNLKTMLEQIIDDTFIYNHQDFTYWCFLQCVAFDWDVENATKVGIPEIVYNVLEDIDAQWDLNISNLSEEEKEKMLNSKIFSKKGTYKAEYDFSKIKLPKECFIDWLQKITS